MPHCCAPPSPEAVEQPTQPPPSGAGVPLAAELPLQGQSRPDPCHGDTGDRRPFVELVVVPRSAELQAVEDALSLALVALVGGTRPLVSPAMVRSYLCNHFGITDDDVSVLRHAPQDFIVRFRRREDLEVVLVTPVAREATPFTLIRRRWSRFTNAAAGSFTFRVLVGLKGARRMLSAWRWRNICWAPLVPRLSSPRRMQTTLMSMMAVSSSLLRGVFIRG